MLTAYNIVTALEYLFRFAYFMILVRILMSWINISPYSRFGQFVYSVTEPILAPIRDLIYNVLGYKGFLDFSPMAAIILLQVAFSLVVRLVYTVF